MRSRCWRRNCWRAPRHGCAPSSAAELRVLVTRPEPAAARTAGRLRALGHEAIVAPLLIPQALDWSVPPGDWQAVALTSAVAPVLGGPGLAALVRLPAYAVGDATAAAVRAAGFEDIRSARGDAAAVFAQAAADGIERILHLAGRDRADVAPPRGLSVGVATVYAAEFAEALPDVPFDLVLLYSARTAARFSALFAGDRARVGIGTLSLAVAAAAGSGWRHVAVAAEATEDALFAAAGLSCEKHG